MSDSDEEMILDSDDADDDIEFIESTHEIPNFDSLNDFARNLGNYFSDFTYKLEGGKISVDIPTSVLPLTQSIVYGYNEEQTLLSVTLEFTKTPNFKEKPKCTCANPVHGTNFIGKSLVEDAISNFFSLKYFGKSGGHPSAPILFQSRFSVNESSLRKLINEGFSPISSAKILSNNGNNLEMARDFLLSGKPITNDVIIPINYDQCPLIYLITDIIDAFYKLNYCCCICGKQLPQRCIKPTSCNSKKCMFQLSQIGLGNSIIQEIRRDPLAADFVFSAFANCLNTKFLNPAPPQDILSKANSVVSSLPPLKQLADSCATDADLFRAIGQDAQDVLRYVLFTNRNQFISLPRKMRIQKLPNDSFQFLTLTADPDKERVFQELKARHGSIFLWHGSHYDRWYPIFHNGLINASGTALQTNGTALGSGIYFAPEASTSWGYVRAAPNNVYRNSAFRTFSCIALCEVAKVSELKNHGWAYTLTKESACIVRFLFISNNFSLTISSLNIPTYEAVLQEIAKRR